MGSDQPASEAQLAHEILARDFSDRYLRRSGFSRFAYSVGFDPDDPLCDYETTWWRAKPNRFSLPIGKAVLGPSHRMSGKEIERLFVEPFAGRAPELLRALRDQPLALVNGHDVDLQAALSLLSATAGVARASEGRFQRTLEEMIEISHGIATRGLGPIVIGRPKLPGRLTFLRLQQLVVNPHLSFPINREMIASGIPQDFRRRYNAKLRAEVVEVARTRSQHRDGYWTFWSMAPGGTPDFKGEGEHSDELLTKRIEPATIKLMNEMGCALMPVYTRFGKGSAETRIELGEVIPPSQVTDATVPGLMAELAEFRRRHGEQNVYYEGELD